MNGHSRWIGDTPQPPFRRAIAAIAGPVLVGAALVACHCGGEDSSSSENLEARIDTARQIYFQRLPSYRIQHRNRFIAVTSSGNEYIGISLVDVERRAFAEPPSVGVFIGSTWDQPSE